MKTVRVMYTTKPEFAARNKLNINAVMLALRAINPPCIEYSVTINDDKKSFVHTCHFKDEQAEKLFFALKEFQNFQTQLKEGGLESPPVSQTVELVGCSRDIFLA